MMKTKSKNKNLLKSGKVEFASKEVLSDGEEREKLVQKQVKFHREPKPKKSLKSTTGAAIFREYITKQLSARKIVAPYCCKKENFTKRSKSSIESALKRNNPETKVYPTMRATKLQFRSSVADVVTIGQKTDRGLLDTVFLYKQFN